MANVEVPEGLTPKPVPSLPDKIFAFNGFDGAPIVFNLTQLFAAQTKQMILSKLGASVLTGSNTGDQDLSGFVLKLAGKGLSTNDYTDIEKTKLAGIPNGGGVMDRQQILTTLGANQVTGTNTGDQDLSNFIVKVANKGLSSNDYTTEEKDKLAGIPVGGGSGRTTISAIRAMTAPFPESTIYTTDKGKEGSWYYDSTDTTSLDNTGTILVTSGGQRYKRIIVAGTVLANWFDVSATPGFDNLSGFQKMFDYASTVTGDVTVQVAKAANYYEVSEAVWVHSSNLTLNLYGDMKTTKKTEPCVFFIAAKRYTTAGPFDQALYNITINGIGNVIDGNGLGSTAPEFGSLYNSTMRIMEINGLTINGLRINNGVYQNCAINTTTNIVIDNCKFDDARDYNGLNINGVPRTTIYDANNPATWTNALVTNCSSNNCDEYGFTAYRSVNVTFQNCLVRKSFKTSAGGFSSECVTDYTLDMKTKFINCSAYGTTKNAFTLQSRSASMDNCLIDGVYQYEFASADQIRRAGGNGISLNSTFGDSSVRNTTIRNCDGWGISSISLSGGDISNMNYENVSISNVNRANYALCGAVSLYGIGENVRFKGLKLDQIPGFGLFLYNNDVNYNKDKGSLYLDDIQITNTDNLAISSAGIKVVRGGKFLAINNNRTLTSATRAINFTNSPTAPATFIPGSEVILDDVKIFTGGSAFVSQGLRINAYEKSFANNVIGDTVTKLVDNSPLKILSEAQDVSTSITKIIQDGSTNFIKRINVPTNTDYVIQPSDSLISFLTFSEPKKATLPDAPLTIEPNGTAYRFYTVKDQLGLCGLYNITIEGVNGALINNKASFILKTARGSVTFYTNGINWYTLNEVNPRLPVLSVSATYSVLLSDFGTSNKIIINVNATGGARTITMPASAPMLGLEVEVVKTDTSSNNVIVSASGSELVNGASTYIIGKAYDSARILSNGNQLVAVQNKNLINPSLTGTSSIAVVEYADNTAAKGAGLVNGNIYRTGDILKVAHA